MKSNSNSPAQQKGLALVSGPSESRVITVSQVFGNSDNLGKLDPHTPNRAKQYILEN